MVLRFQAQGLIDGDVDFVFDEQGKQQGYAMDVWRQIKKILPTELAQVMGRPPISDTDTKFVPLQAADFLAWQVRRIHDLPIPSRHIPSVRLLSDHSMNDRSVITESWTGVEVHLRNVDESELQSML